MNHKISFKEWLGKIFKGVWQALCWIGRAFNPKYKTVFWRVIWGIITVCVVIFTGILVYQYNYYHTREINRYGDSERISYYYKFFKPYGKKGVIQHIRSGKVTVKDIDWIALCEDTDSLFVFARKGKRGYINRYTGQVAIPEQYPAAWNFSSGIAAVADGDSVMLINCKGERVHDTKFYRHPANRGYLYHGNFCAMTAPDGRMGLIDREGKWGLAPKYEHVEAAPKNFWKVKETTENGGLYYTYNDSAEKVIESGYQKLEISEDLGIVVTLPTHLQVSYGFDGIKSDQFLCRDIETMYYNTDEKDDEGNFIVEASTLMRYRMSDGYEGLCTVDGTIITEPLYWEVLPISKDTYLFKYKDAGVIINSKGEIVKHQNP